MRSRAKIVEATLRLIAVDGFAAVTVVAVAQAAGVSRQTVYSIFGSREDLITRTMEELAVSVLTEIRSNLEVPATVREYVVELIVAGRRSVRDHPALTALMNMDATNPVLHPDVIQHAIPVVRELLSPAMDLPDSDATGIGTVADATVLDDIVLIATRLGISVVLFDDRSEERRVGKECLL